MQQSAVLTLPPLSVLLKEGLKGAMQRDGFFSFSPAPSAPTPVFETTQPEVRGKCDHPNEFKSDGITGLRSVKDITDVTLFPRRKAGDNQQEGGRGPVVLSVELLQSFYGMPLHVAAKKLVKFESFDLKYGSVPIFDFFLVPGYMSDCNQESMQVIIREHRCTTFPAQTRTRPFLRALNITRQSLPSC